MPTSLCKCIWLRTQLRIGLLECSLRCISVIRAHTLLNVIAIVVCVPESLTCNLANQESGLLAMLLCIRASTGSYRCKHASDIGKVLCILLLNLYKALIFMLFSLIKG